LDIS